MPCPSEEVFCREEVEVHRLHRPQVARADQCWSMDFAADDLFNGRRIRALVDNFSRQCLAIQVDHSIKAEQVVSTMEGLRLFADWTTQRIQVGNGCEFFSKAMDKWASNMG